MRYVADNLDGAGMSNLGNRLMIQYGNKVKEAGLEGLRISYITRTFRANLPQKNWENLLGAMVRYGDNFWWESKDPLQVAMYQIFEDTLMVPFSLFHEGLEKLVGRPVWIHELGLNIEGIRKEARLGIRRLKTGIGISDEQREEAIKRSIEMLEKYCLENGKEFLPIKIESSVPQSPENDKRDESEIDRSGEDGWLNP